MDDERVQFLVNSISSACDDLDKKKVFESVDNSKDVKDFLDDTK
jgi:hypothetical protein